MDEWEAEVDKLKAKASGVSADTQLELNKQIEELEGKIEQGMQDGSDHLLREPEAAYTLHFNPENTVYFNINAGESIC